MLLCFSSFWLAAPWTCPQVMFSRLVLTGQIDASYSGMMGSDTSTSAEVINFVHVPVSNVIEMNGSRLGSWQPGGDRRECGRQKDLSLAFELKCPRSCTVPASFQRRWEPKHSIWRVGFEHILFFMLKLVSFLSEPLTILISSKFGNNLKLSQDVWKVFLHSAIIQCKLLMCFC